MGCSGACCENFTLVVNGKHITHASWLEGGFAAGDLGRLAIPAAEDSRFNCTMFDPDTQLCRDYLNRPAACRQFPNEALQDGVISNSCQYCGYTQETQDASCSGER